MNRNLLVLFVGLLPLSAPVPSAAWEQTYPRGPVHIAPTKHVDKSGKPGPELGIRTLGPSLPHLSRSTAERTDHPDVGSVLSVRTVTYPSQHGASVGVGWDFLINQKKYASCITFDQIDENKYQTADVSLQEVTDDETIDITLNAEFSGSVGGTIEIVEAKADATSTLNSLHHTTSNDLIFTSHASITSGIKYAWKKDGQNNQAVKLTSEMEALARKDPPAFRAKCGDGFVGSVGFGTDLNLLLHFHHLNIHDRLELSFDSKASAGIADVFSAKGSSKLKSTIDLLSDRGSLEISFIQNGGIIESIPTNLNDARLKIQGLAKEEFAGPRPIFLGIVPYSELPNWPGYYLLDTSNIRQRAVRYAIRLRSIYFEVMNIREDYYRDRASLPSQPDCKPGGICRSADAVDDLYFYSYRHRLRLENLGEIAKEIADKLALVQNVLAILNGPKCNPAPVASFAGDGSRKSFEDSLNRFNKSKDDCENASNDLIKETNSFDDYSLWSLLPIPQNSIPQSAINSLLDMSSAIDVRRNAYSQYVFRHWVERVEQVRCRLFSECLTPDERRVLYDAIVKTMIGNANPPSGSTLLLGEHKLCTGQYHSEDGQIADPGCQSELFLDCDHRTAQDFEQKAKDTCEIKTGAYSHSYTPVGGSIDGNQCGYQYYSVACFGFQPAFP
ncbi:hypothetical protein [Bradyrhizobium sp. 76]|uniref:hypothetical protein n=1 Tax=Bradyrhizobium sp. 76 TaxID=2782680 RepID=UPI001FF9CF97|nr:hypothetical protein [Bradyrhizobium sp. 76]MCK1409535.1 hypothetical protein [Bradyrhizobium sp. 76]